MSICNAKLLSLYCLVALILLNAPAVQAADPDPQAANDATASGAVTQAYAEINDAVLNRDLNKIMSFLADDFTEVNKSGGTINRDQERKVYQGEFNEIKSMTCKFVIQNIISGSTGTYSDVTIHMDGIGVKKVMFLKFQAPFTNDLVVHDLWVNTPDGWKIKTRQTLKDQTVIKMN